MTAIADGSGQPKKINYTAIEQAAIVAVLALKRQEAAQTDLFQRTHEARANERMRIARELHDETSQAIAALKVALETTEFALPTSPERASEHLTVARSIADGLLDGVHRATADLCPAIFDDLGLQAALAWYGESRLEPLGISMDFENDPCIVRMPPTVETTIFGVAQEALTNIVRHSGGAGTAVRVRLQAEADGLILEISDNGRSFDASLPEWDDPLYPGCGLRGMRERTEIFHATLSITSRPG